MPRKKYSPSDSSVTDYRHADKRKNIPELLQTVRQRILTPEEAQMLVVIEVDIQVLLD